MTTITIDEDEIGPVSRGVLLLFVLFGLTFGTLESLIVRSVRRAFR